jgi:hypothetical protein
MKYRKKSIVIEAHQLTHHSLMEICRWMNSKCEWEENGDYITLTIPTLEGDMKAINGDYIIKGIKDEFYPCKSDIFEATYEKVEEFE